MNTAASPLAHQRDISFSNHQLSALIFPLMLEQLLTISVGLADSMMVSSVGEAAISAVSLVDSISNLMIYIFSALATGGAATVGQYLGRGEREDACHAGQQLIALLLGVSLFLTALLYIFRSFLLTHLFGQIGADVMEATDTYYSIVMASIPAIALYNGGAALMRMMSRSDITFKVSLWMNIINVVGNYLLIFRFGFDVSGVAYPTLVSRTVAAVWMLALLANPERELHLCAPRAFRPDKKLLRNIAYIGIPSGVENGMFHLGRLILFSLISTFGTASIVANAVGNTVGNFHCFVGIAIGMGMTTVVSQCIGAGRPDLARCYLRKLLRMSYLLMGMINLLLLLAIPLILRIYGLEEESARLARTVLILHGTSAIFLWIPAFFIPVFLRAAGDAKYTMNVSMTTMWTVRVLFAYIIGKYMGYGVVGVWFAHAILDWVVRSVIFIHRYRSGKWEQKAVRIE